MAVSAISNLSHVSHPSSLPVSMDQNLPPSTPASHDFSSVSMTSHDAPETLNPPTNGSNHSTTAPAPAMEKHPKGKRKRTAAKDKMILEEAYSNNPKPDKQARLEIVQRVSLNEKEVQIWFQNRRQNDRRKSRPLSPQEIAALRYGSMHVISTDPISNPTSATERPCPTSDPTVSRLASPRPLEHVTPSIPRSHSDIITSTPYSSHDHSIRDHPQMTTPRHAAPSPLHESQDGTHAISSNSVGYLSNRWNLGSSFSTPSTLGRGGDDSFRLDSFPPSMCSSEPSLTPSQSQSQSKVRLSLSLEGKAELVSNHQASPTRSIPPRPSSTTPNLPHVRQRSLQRSSSAVPSITLPPISALTNSLPPRLGRGRSRDVHAWEFCADADTRDELTTQAENESNGSAVAAISLLRSSSSILQPSGTKRNASTSRPPQRLPPAKKTKTDRTGWGTTRLETPGAGIEKSGNDFGKVKVSMLVSPSGDSDKENWSPDENGNPGGSPHRRTLPPVPPKSLNPRRQGRVLQEQRVPALNNRANTAPTKGRDLIKQGIEIFDDTMKRPGAHRPDEVENFMRGDVSPSKKPDMDCVAGLLSLSQGAWRATERP